MNQQPSDYEEYYKVVIVGPSGAGKTNIVQTFDKGVRPNHTIPTIGIDYCSKVIKIDNNRKVKIQIWDTAGQQQYRAVTMTHYRNAAGALVVFDLTNRNSFDSASQWIRDVKERANENVVIGVIGNKMDLDRRAVSRQEGENLASREHAFYMETSIFNVDSLRNVFERLAQEINRSHKSKNLQFSRTNVELGNQSKTDKKCQC